MSQLIFLSPARNKMAMVRLPRALLKTTFFCPLLPLRGREPHFRLGSTPIIWLLSLSPSDVRRPEFTKCEHLVYLLCDPHSLLTVTFWLLDTLIQYGRIVSVLPLRLRELSRDNIMFAIVSWLFEVSPIYHIYHIPYVHTPRDYNNVYVI